ncbi:MULTISPECIES: response regulator [Aphanothece]|uniref:response regulator n=1 Tax=Aphanothece TaxID=1121 RepID=UPI00398F5C55
MSHDIRTPLNAIIGMIDLLKDSHLDAGQREMVSTVQSSGKHLLGLINDVLDIAQIETGVASLNETRFNLTTLLEACVAQFQPEARRKGLNLQLQAPPKDSAWLTGDDLKLSQIMNNLVGNALKYTVDGSIHIAVELAPRSDATVEATIAVADTGMGIEADFLPKVFEEFSRVRPSERSVESTGLGLAICARLCKTLGGAIAVASRAGEGSRFTVRIPFTPAAEEPREATAAPRAFSGDGQLRILIADDNRVNQRVLQLMLERLGLHADVANDGQEAVDRISQGESMDLVFMDLEMPRLDGLAATRTVRAQGLHRPYIIALTAYSFDSQRRDCEEAGMNDFLTKPLRREALTAAITRFEAWRQDGASQGQPEQP